MASAGLRSGFLTEALLDRLCVCLVRRDSTNKNPLPCREILAKPTAEMLQSKQTTSALLVFPANGEMYRYLTRFLSLWL